MNYKIKLIYSKELEISAENIHDAINQSEKLMHRHVAEAVEVQFENMKIKIYSNLASLPVEKIGELVDRG